MNFYALQVRTGEEEAFLSKARQAAGDLARFHLPRRNLSIKRRGKSADAVSPLFPGYLFLSSEGELDRIFPLLRKIPGFFRFLPSNESAHPLADRDLEVLRHFMSFGEFADKSKVSFDENDRIVVHSGPLKGYEGQIVKVDRRKGRAKLRLSFCNSEMLVDLGFELIEKAGVGGNDGDGSAQEQDIHHRGGLRGDDPGQGDRA